MSDEQREPDLHPLPGGGHVAYRFAPGRSPTVVYLCGYGSEMTGTKAGHLHRVCAEAGHAYLRFDYRGLGDGDHRLSRDADLARLARALHDVLGVRDA